MRSPSSSRVSARKSPPDRNRGLSIRVGSDPSNLFSVDLEEWFHVCGVGGLLAAQNWDRLPARVEPTTHALLEMLDRRHVRATFFIVGWVAERYPHLIEAVRAAGHDIGSHSYGHERE